MERHASERATPAIQQRFVESMTSQLADQLAGIASSAIDHAPQRAIEAAEALRRLHNGTYGICVDCGARIASYRLLMRPEAERCGDCQYRLNESTGAPTEGF